LQRRCGLCRSSCSFLAFGIGVGVLCLMAWLGSSYVGEQVGCTLLARRSRLAKVMRCARKLPTWTERRRQSAKELTRDGQRARTEDEDGRSGRPAARTRTSARRAPKRRWPAWRRHGQEMSKGLGGVGHSSSLDVWQACTSLPCQVVTVSETVPAVSLCSPALLPSSAACAVQEPVGTAPLLAGDWPAAARASSGRRRAATQVTPTPARRPPPAACACLATGGYPVARESLPSSTRNLP
jgi:hypothetical protein